MLRTRFILRPAERYPADPRAVFILALSVFSSVIGLIVSQSPSSLEATLPWWGSTLWSVGLGGGSVLALAGLSRDSVNGIIMEQVGSIMVAAAALFYSAIALWVLGGQAVQPISIILAWGVACVIRWWQLQLLLIRMNNAKLQTQADQVAVALLDHSELGGKCDQ